MRLGATAASGQWFAQTRVTGCGTTNCVPGSADPVDGQQLASIHGFPETDGQSEFHKLVFPAGDYELTLIADAAPVMVTMTLGGLRGSTTLRPGGDAPSVTRSVTPTLLPTPQAATELSAGSQANISSALGVLAFSISFRYTARVGDASNSCYYNGSRPAPAGEYLPGCPGDDAVIGAPSFVILQQGVNVPTGEYGIVLVRGKQVWGQGVWSVGASLIQKSNPASFLWLSAG